MSAFLVLFIASVFSFTIQDINKQKLFSIIALIIGGYCSYIGFDIELNGFYTSGITTLFEIVLFIVISAYILSETDTINITQSLFLTTASIALLQSATILNFVLSFEALSIISFVLVSFAKNETQIAGALKLFIAGSIATAFIVLGVAFYLLENHSLNAPIQSVGIYGQIGLWILLIGVFYKLTIVPMHLWAVDTYSSVRPAHSALLSGVAKSVAVIGVFHIFTPFLENFTNLENNTLIILAIVTMSLGNILALFQKQITKILAYSSIAHAGYILLAFVAIKSQYSQIALLYVAIAYIFTQTALFILVDKLGDAKTNIYLEDIKGLAQIDKLSALIFTIQLFSLAGIPLLSGFISKAILVYAVVDVNLPFVAFITLLNSALSVGYYAWIVKHIYFDEHNNENKKIKKVTTLPLIAQFILVGGTIYFGIFAYLIFEVI